MNNSKIERINKLKEISEILKEEFIGLDSIIDQLITSLTPWYVTPEIITRPVIISLWGMTGTGKSSIVRRVVDLLDLKDRSLFVDCGEITGDGSYFKLADKINEFFYGDDMGDANMGTHRKDNVFVLDEFQYARTLDSQKNEIEKAAIRPVWSLIDSGKLDVYEWQYGITYFKQFLVDFGDFAKRHPLAPISNFIISDKDILVDYINELGYFFYDRRPVDIGEADDTSDYIPRSKTKKEEGEEKSDPYAPVNVLAFASGNPRGIIYKQMNKKGMGEGQRMLQRLKDATTLSEFHEILLEVGKVINTPKIVDCSKSLIFIVGNLDEAFQVEDEVSPDMNADIFNDITSKVTIHDIKVALQDRFRAEQVARLGNNLIKYPTLREKDFRTIIEKELKKIFTQFKEETGISVDYGQDFIDLSYSEGVYPTQGVRPVFTTIITLITPVLSEIILWSEETGEKVVSLRTSSDYPSELGFRVPKISLIISTPEEKGVKEKRMELDLQLGSLRYPGNRKRRYSTSVHEVGHAILNCWWTGNVPVNIVSVSTDDGGFCDTYDSKHAREISSMEDIKADIEISMAGYEAELLVFGNYDNEGRINRSKVLAGSSDDLRKAWEKLSDAAYSWGFFEFKRFSCPNTQIRNDNGVPVGHGDTFLLDKKIDELWEELRKETSEILLREKNLLKQAALILSETGSISQSQFIELIKKYGKKLTLEHMEIQKNLDDWYLTRLKEL